jgi:hypothetical protein
MLNRRNKIAAIAGTVVAAGAVVLSGLTAASATSAPVPTEHLQLDSVSATSNRAPVIATGVFTASGVDHQGSGNIDKVVFPGGTFKINHTNGAGPFHFSPKTCVFSGTIHGTYKIYGGTGRYAGISGHGKYVADVLGIGPRTANGKCNPNQNAAPVAQQEIIRASGPLTL